MQVTLRTFTPNPELIIEEAARTCYASMAKIKDGSAATLIRRCIKRGHTSVLEQAHATFHINGISRFTANQFVRHRLVSVCQESQRYVKETKLNYVKTIDDPVFEQAMKDAFNAYNVLIKRGYKPEEARAVLPGCWCTQMRVVANFREWRHILKMRLPKEAQAEFRELAGLLLVDLKRIAPTVFEDFQ